MPNLLKIKLSILLLLLTTALFAQTGQLKGTIHDAQTNEALPFATVQIQGTTVGATTDNDGNFLLTKLTPGEIRIKVSFIGYQTVLSDPIEITNNRTAFIYINLEEEDNNLSEVIVRPQSFRKKIEAPLSMQSITTAEIESNPGSNRDISRVIQSFPGVGSTPAYRNDIIIRGGGPSENRFYLDGVEIPILNHFSTQGSSGGPVGIINADFIRNVDYYAAAFPAEKYNALSGILDFTQKDGNSEKLNSQLTIGSSEAALTFDGPIGKKTNYIFSVRRSYLQYLFSALELPFLPTFNDYQLRVRSNIDNHNQLTFISIGSLDHLSLNTDLDKPDDFQQYALSTIPENDQWSYTIGAVYKLFYDHGYHAVIISRNHLNNSIEKYLDNNSNNYKTLDYLSTEAENKLRYEWHYKGENIKFVSSVNTETAHYQNDTKQQITINNNPYQIEYNTNLDFVKYGFSAQLSKNLFIDDLVGSFGLRCDGNSYNSNMSNPFCQFSPRFSLSYSATPQLKINAGIGRYYQLAAYTTLGYREKGELVNEESAKYIGLNQYNIGLEHTFNDNILLSVEGFYKDYFQYPIDIETGASLANQGADYSLYGLSDVDFSGKGRAYGFEILNRINYQSFTLLASYTYVRSDFTNLQNEFIPSSWDSKHLLTITSSKKLPKNWQVGLKWRFVGGLPYTPYDAQESASIQNWHINGGPTFDYDALNSHRLPNFHQLDVRVDKKIYFNHWSLMLYLDIQNAYNFQNTSPDILMRQKNQDGSYQTTSDNQNYILKSISRTNGTVLPTIGIMIKI
ncbi:TonB-dependent receptor [Gammaproteobacteria bacterium]|nr:TonB-dependent receptor [Gammaproteobacteria bacterium]